MKSFEKPFFSLTVGDLMSRYVVSVAQDMSLAAAARLLAAENISGAPVVDAENRCVGVLSATDFVWLSQSHHKSNRKPDDPMFCEWQMVDWERMPSEAVKEVMTCDPVTASPSTSIASLAGMMRNAHIHRVIVVDAARCPVGIVTSTDILAAIAQADPVRGRFEEPSFQGA